VLQRLDDYDLRTLNVQFLRRTISLVSQEPILFDCSIEENIAYGLEGVTHEQVVEATTQANIHSFIIGLPQV
jgi:ABC-type multidrug transport system fused ATPase/permease subunit